MEKRLSPLQSAGDILMKLSKNITGSAFWDSLCFYIRFLLNLIRKLLLFHRCLLRRFHILPAAVQPDRIRRIHH